MYKNNDFTLLLLIFISTFCVHIYAEDNTDNTGEVFQEKIAVYGKKMDKIGEAISASQGYVSHSDIEKHAILRPGEILEFIPGMVVTQHSGSGKANQYFLRGFNLDHGTDFSMSVDNMPLNMRTHGHGQGYTDLSFITPEFINQISYRKGPYYAESGDFSTAGSANLNTINSLEKSMVQLELGQDNYFRSVMGYAFNPNIAGLQQDSLLLGWEYKRYDGPWSNIKEDLQKHNLILKYTANISDTDYALTFMGYDNQWQAADQIPQRAVEQGLINLLGSLDTDTGGKSSRYSLSLAVTNHDWSLDAYAIMSNLNLFSNFTYFLNDPVNGDEFQQVDDRKIFGSQLQGHMILDWAGNQVFNKFGVQLRYDDIDEVGLYHTAGRARLSTVRQDKVAQLSVGMFWDVSMDISDDVTAYLGARFDYMDVDVESNIDVNSGADSDGQFSIKTGLQFDITQNVSTYLNAGQSFHSNDARGATISISPDTFQPASPVDLLVRGQGAEAGIRYSVPDQLNMSLSLWILDLDSELLFVGDAGSTETGRASRRKGIEFTTYYWLNEVFSSDLELAISDAEYTDTAVDEGREIEGALPFVASFGINWELNQHWQTSIRVRHFGDRILDSYNKQPSDDFTVFNLSLTYKMRDWQIKLDALNLFNSKDRDIEYFYVSRLPGEHPNGIADNHFHPIEPRTLRVKIKYMF